MQDIDFFIASVFSYLVYERLFATLDFEMAYIRLSAMETFKRRHILQFGFCVTVS